MKKANKFKCKYEQRCKFCPKLNVFYSQQRYDALMNDIAKIKKAIYLIENSNLKASTVATPSVEVNIRGIELYVPQDLLYPVIKAKEKILLEYLKNAKERLNKEIKTYKDKCFGCKATADEIREDILLHVLKNPPEDTYDFNSHMVESMNKIIESEKVLMEIEKRCKNLIKIPKYLK